MTIQLTTEASELRLDPARPWPFTLKFEGLTWTFNRPIGKAIDEFQGNIYIAIDAAGVRRELLVFND